MLDKIKDVILQKDICVLATVSGNRPHCSLMAYLPSGDCRFVYMLTSKSTKKYHNCLGNPSVSLLIDTRDDPPGSPRSSTKALTIEGRCFPLDEGDLKNRVRQEINSRFPHLQKLAEHPDSDIIGVEVDSVLLLDGVAESHFMKMD